MSLHKLCLDREIRNNDCLAMTINPYKHSVHFMEQSQTVQTQIVASDRGLHRLLTECSIEIWRKCKLLKMQMGCSF